jgi:hypothetical protein
LSGSFPVWTMDVPYRTKNRPPLVIKPKKMLTLCCRACTGRGLVNRWSWRMWWSAISSLYGTPLTNSQVNKV